MSGSVVTDKRERRKRLGYVQLSSTAWAREAALKAPVILAPSSPFPLRLTPVACVLRRLQLLLSSLSAAFLRCFRSPLIHPSHSPVGACAPTSSAVWKAPLQPFHRLSCVSARVIHLIIECAVFCSVSSAFHFFSFSFLRALSLRSAVHSRCCILSL